MDRYRRKHTPAAGAAADIMRTARIAGWPTAAAEEAARLMLASGVDPQRAACLFRDAVEWRQ